jgi:hypothetical protein
MHKSQKTTLVFNKTELKWLNEAIDSSMITEKEKFDSATTRKEKERSRDQLSRYERLRGLIVEQL